MKFSVKFNIIAFQRSLEREINFKVGLDNFAQMSDESARESVTKLMVRGLGTRPARRAKRDRIDSSRESRKCFLFHDNTHVLWHLNF